MNDLKIIPISIEKRRAAWGGAEPIICCNGDYVLQISFDEEWTQFQAKTARFVFQEKGEVRYIDQVFYGGEVAVPILANITHVYIGVYAGDLYTTTPAKVPCELSIRCQTGAQTPPPEDVYDQIMALLKSGDSAGFVIGHGLKLETDGITLVVDSANEAEADNTLPITSAAVYTQIGNINALLETI